MNRLHIAIAVICAALTLCGASGRASTPESRVALVLGNAAYRNAAPLKNPLNDARDMAKALRELGFQVIEIENANKQQLERAIGQFSAKLTQGSVGLFYYSGHGIQVSGHNYLIPVDAELAHETSVMLETVDVDVILQLMNMAQTRVNLVILDACRSNPFERRFRALGRGLAPIEQAPRGTLVAYSTAPGKVASDGDGANGLYTAELLKAIREPGLTVEQVFKRVRVAVGTATNDDQTPWEMSSLTGDFYFRPAGTVPFPTTGPAVQPQANAAPAPTAASQTAASAPPATQTALLPPPTAPGAPGAAEEGAFRCPHPGTVIQYNNGAVLTFSRENGFRCAYSDGTGRSAEKFAAFADDSSFLASGLDKLWPLKVGAELKISVNISGGSSSERFTILRREAVTVAAGTFDAFVVAHEEQGGTAWGQTARRLYWFAPELGLVVKSSYTLIRSGYAGNFSTVALNPGDYEAVRISTSGGAAAQ